VTSRVTDSSFRDMGYRNDVHFAEQDVPCDLTKDVELCLFRVAQEALANVVKRVSAGSAHVDLGTRHAVSLRISDEGKGFDPALRGDGAGIGLIRMQERVRQVGGLLTVRSELNRGTEILAEVPLSAAVNKEQATTYAEEGLES
jgi:signal transduction histidine kinase